MIVPVETNLDFMAGSSEYTWDTVFEGAVDTVLEDMDGQYDYILLDCPAGLGRGITYAETHANDAIIVQVPTRSSERDAHRLKKELSGKIPIWIIGNEFVWNDEQFLSPSDFVRSVDVRDLLGMERPCVLWLKIMCISVFIHSLHGISLFSRPEQKKLRLTVVLTKRNSRKRRAFWRGWYINGEEEGGN